MLHVFHFAVHNEGILEHMIFGQWKQTIVWLIDSVTDIKIDNCFKEAPLRVGSWTHADYIQVGCTSLIGQSIIHFCNCQQETKHSIGPSYCFPCFLHSNREHSWRVMGINWIPALIIICSLILMYHMMTHAPLYN